MLAYIINICVITGITIILVWSLDFMVGHGGIFSVMHAVFFGIGAYASAQIAMHFSTNLLLVMLFSAALSGTIALLTSLPVLRIREEYFVIAAIGYQTIASTLFGNWDSVTGGAEGISGIPPATIGHITLLDPWQYLIAVVLTLALTWLILFVCIRSAFGRALRALRDNEIAAIAYGRHPITLRIAATTISGAIAGLAGTLYAFYFTFISSESFSLDYSVLLVAMVVIGGAGTLLGPVLGAIFIITFPALLDFLNVPSSILGPLQQIIYGSVIVLLMLVMPEGLIKLTRLRTRNMGVRHNGS